MKEVYFQSVKKKLIFTGASGFLGYHLMRVAEEDWEIYGIYNSKDFDCENATHLQCNICNYIELGNMFDDIEPDAVVHTAAISDTSFCEQNAALSYAVNVEATKNLAGICSDFKIPFVFTSTDLVFDGTKGNYSEEDEKNPLMIYGEHKAMAEDEVQKIYPESTIVRLPLMFGEPNASTGNYLQKFISELKNGKRAKLFTDEYRSVCGAKSISEGILQLLNHSGVFHLAGKEKLSRFEFGTKAAKAFQLNSSLIDICSQKDVKFLALRPADVSLNISKAIKFGFSPLSVERELQLIAERKYF